MKTGSDYTGLGKGYASYRLGYSNLIMNFLLQHTGLDLRHGTVADIGAGTGIWTNELARENGHLEFIAVEPNDDMRENGMLYTSKLRNVSWRKGSAEDTTLDSNSIDWVTMASSFHWTEPKQSLPEFHRILNDKGYVTLLWNPLVRTGDRLQEDVEAIIKHYLPNYSREFRTGENSKEVLLSSGLFENVAEMRHRYLVEMPKERYLHAWSVSNHLKQEAGTEFSRILESIESLVINETTLKIPYETKSWTARKK